MSDETKNPDRLLRLEEVAERFRCSTQHVQRLVKDGAIRAVNVNTAIRVREAEVERFLKLGWSDNVVDIKKPPESIWSQVLFILFGGVAGFFAFGCVGFVLWTGFSFAPAGFVAGTVLCTIITLLSSKGKKDRPEV